MGVDGRLGVRGCKMVSKAGHAKDRDEHCGKVKEAYRADQCRPAMLTNANKHKEVQALKRRQVQACRPAVQTSASPAVETRA
eukprot:1136934-Pelagomonas_calceolata.AAC.1